jgi:hypothetical protein
MTTLKNTSPASDTPEPEQSTRRILELLEKLAAAEELAATAPAAGVDEKQMRSGLLRAAELIRQGHDGQLAIERRWPQQGSLLDWREMTVAEALQILSDHAIAPDAQPKPR